MRRHAASVLDFNLPTRPPALGNVPAVGAKLACVLTAATSRHSTWRGEEKNSNDLGESWLSTRNLHNPPNGTSEIHASPTRRETRRERPTKIDQRQVAAAGEGEREREGGPPCENICRPKVSELVGKRDQSFEQTLVELFLHNRSSSGENISPQARDGAKARLEPANESRIARSGRKVANRWARWSSFIIIARVAQWCRPSTAGHSRSVASGKASSVCHLLGGRSKFGHAGASITVSSLHKQLCDA
ncbi:Hypothetical predicted protein [Olea europaea subsp. europaea]|uniref:Uncharacterized protein n=1 Tax=Olea europaea subsp. europaea TaxID=158383 RepID=A0A8S0TR87_OLEEU|nr:Hypothetical predicted protein [Olea europaea subsp. europaea]